MDRIKNIFFGSNSEKPENILKYIPITFENHKIGIAAVAKYLQPNFAGFSGEQNEIVDDLIYYFTGNGKYSKNLNKGIMIMGTVGNGKSFIFEIFKMYTKEVLRCNGFQVHNYTDLKAKIATNGIIELEYFRFQERTPTVYFDDFGKGISDANYFGTKIELIDSLIDIRYTCFERRILTHISTNLSKKDFETIDARVTDRMRQMFNIYNLKGNSYRK